MKKWVVVLIVVMVVILGGIGWYVGGLNKVVRMDEQVNEAWAQIDTQLQRRNDLVPNLVNTAKGYMKHEKEVLKNISDARAAMMGAKTVDEKIKSAQSMDSALSRLFMIVEQYPNLKANESFARLMDELAGTENRISVARMRYNESVKAFNSYIREVFGKFFAKKRDLDKPHPYFEVQEKAKEVPEVKF